MICAVAVADWWVVGWRVVVGFGAGVFCVAMAGIVVAVLVIVLVFSVVEDEVSVGKKEGGWRREEYQRECDCW
jgi:uncharacterized membrane protein